jgi:hypothetical protein
VMGNNPRSGPPSSIGTREERTEVTSTTYVSTDEVAVPSAGHPPRSRR